MCIATSAFLQGWGLCNGAIGGAVGIVFREGERPPESLPAFVLARFEKYLGPVYLSGAPKVAPIAPIGRLLDCRRRCSRLMIPLAPAWELRSARAMGRLAAPGAMPSASSPTHPLRRLRNRTTADYKLRALGRRQPGAVRTENQGATHPPSISIHSAAASGF